MCNSVLRYNWFETNLASFMGKYPLPAYYDGEDLLAFVRQYKGKYMSDFTELLINGPIRGYSDSIYQRIAEQKDCIDVAFDTVIEILESVNNSQYSNGENKIDQLLKDVENDFCVTNISSIKDNIREFFTRYNIDRIISDCRSSPIHQDRYDENIETFHLLFLDFFKLTEILDRYYLKLEHGFADIEI